MRASRLLMAIVCFGSCLALRIPAQPVLQVDFNARSSSSYTEPGFQPFVMPGTGQVTSEVNNTYEGMVVSVAPAGSNLDDRLRTQPTASADFTQVMLLQDFIFSAAGIDIRIDGLLAEQTYEVKIWSYDASSTAGGTRYSDWTANGVLMADNYAMTAATPPTFNDQYTITFRTMSDFNGTIAIQGRRDALSATQPSVFLNALQLAIPQEEPPTINRQPQDLEVYAGEIALLNVQVGGSTPFQFQWKKNNEDVPGATNQSLRIDNAQDSDAAAYSVFVTNAFGTNLSQAATLTIKPVTDIRTALLGHWPLEQGIDLLPDLSGNANDLTGTNLTELDYVAGQHGNALSFNGTNALAWREHTNSVSLPASSHPSYTVALWVKGPPNQSDRRIFSESANTNNNPLVNIGTHSQGSNGAVNIYIRSAGGSAVVNHRQSSLIAFDDTWHHITWVDDKGFARLYVDGVRDTNNFDYSRVFVGANITSLGGILRSNASNWAVATLDDVAAWGRALTEAEIAHVMANGPVVGTTPPHADTITVVQGQVTLTITTPDPAKPHRILEAPALPATQWTEVTGVTWTVTGSNQLRATFPQGTGQQSFYRISY